MEYNKDMSIDEYFYLSWALTAANARVDDFDDNEIRCLYPLNPQPLPKFEDWDGILKKGKEPIQGDLGMNKEREMFHFRNGIWKPIKG